MKPVLTDEEIRRLYDEVFCSKTFEETIREAERLTRERMAARIEKLEAVRDAAIKMRGLKFNGAWLPTIPTLEEFDAALAAERGEEER